MQGWSHGGSTVPARVIVIIMHLPTAILLALSLFLAGCACDRCGSCAAPAQTATP